MNVHRLLSDKIKLGQYCKAYYRNLMNGMSSQDAEDQALSEIDEEAPVEKVQQAYLREYKRLMASGANEAAARIGALQASKRLKG